MNGNDKALQLTTLRKALGVLVILVGAWGVAASLGVIFSRRLVGVASDLSAIVGVENPQLAAVEHYPSWYWVFAPIFGVMMALVSALYLFGGVSILRNPKRPASLFRRFACAAIAMRVIFTIASIFVGSVLLMSAIQNLIGSAIGQGLLLYWERRTRWPVG